MRSLVSLLLLLLCLEGILSSVHDHKDGKNHPECVLCAVKSQKQVDDSAKIELKGHLPFPSRVPGPERTGLPGEEIPRPVYARGPPC